MERYAEKKEAARETSRPGSKAGTPSRYMRPTAAAKTAGTLMRKETRKASSPENLLKSRAEVVSPERERPGIAESPWTTPSTTPSMPPRDPAVRPPLGLSGGCRHLGSEPRHDEILAGSDEASAKCVGLAYGTHARSILAGDRVEAVSAADGAAYTHDW